MPWVPWGVRRRMPWVPWGVKSSSSESAVFIALLSSDQERSVQPPRPSVD